MAVGKVIAVVLCVVVPLGVAGLLIAATVANFSPLAVQGWCRSGSQTSTGAHCVILRSGPPSWDTQYRATLPDVQFTTTNATEVDIRTCTLLRVFDDSEGCNTYIGLWNTSAPPKPCWHGEGRSWWLGATHPECWYEEPQPMDTFDKALPLTCAAALLLGAVCFWVPRIRQWYLGRSRRQDPEGAPLVHESEQVRGHDLVDMVTVSAVWMGGNNAAVVVGDAKGGAYPCEVQKVYDVGTTMAGDCVVCLAEAKSVVLWPCRHLCSCEDCSIRLKKCPICRSVISRRLRLELHQLSELEDDDSPSEPRRSVPRRGSRRITLPVPNRTNDQAPRGRPKTYGTVSDDPEVEAFLNPPNSTNPLHPGDDPQHDRQGAERYLSTPPLTAASDYQAPPPPPHRDEGGPA